jgi:hypothetical protein
LEKTEDQISWDFLSGILAVFTYVMTAMFLRCSEAYYTCIVTETVYETSITLLLIITLLFLWAEKLDGLPEAQPKRLMWKIYINTRYTFHRVFFWAMDKTAISKLVRPLVGFIDDLEASSFSMFVSISMYDDNKHETTNSYRYTSLDGDRKIRLLKVLRRELFKPLECEVIEVILDNAKSFEALSHIHKPETASSSIWIRDSNGVTALKVPLAIHQFLQFWHTFTGEKLFWIDVVCVNQEDDDEANKQAAMMREIYRHASRVIVWLGPQSNAQDAFLARETLSYVAMSPPSTSTQSLQNLLKSLQGRCALGLNVVAGLLYQLNRQWVVPVVTVCDEVHIIYGDVCFRWDTLAKVVKRLSDAILEDKRVQVKSGVDPDGSNGLAKMWEMLPLMSNVTTIKLFRDLVKLTKPISMDDDLARCMCFKATDQSDRVYAMLAIIGGIAVEVLSQSIVSLHSRPTTRQCVRCSCHLRVQLHVGTTVLQQFQQRTRNPS